MDCQNTPYGQRPPELRDYLYQWNLSITEAQRDFNDWMMLIDERTLLNQSPFRVDASERYLRSKLPNLEQPFIDRITGALSVSIYYLAIIHGLFQFDVENAPRFSMKSTMF